jgi:uncharacterized membrane protein (UPF0127 family)
MSSKWRTIRDADTDAVILERARWCSSFWCHFRGLQFVTNLPEHEGLLFVTDSESRVQTAIHMLFMFFSIAVVWVDKSGVVVDSKLARPWRLSYMSQAPAQYYIEARPSLLDRVHTGQRLRFDEAD